MVAAADSWAELGRPAADRLPTQPPEISLPAWQPEGISPQDQRAAALPEQSQARRDCQGTHPAQQPQGQQGLEELLQAERAASRLGPLVELLPGRPGRRPTERRAEDLLGRSGFRDSLLAAIRLPKAWRPAPFRRL